MMKKLIAYILAAVFAVVIQSGVYAEGNGDAIVVIPWDNGAENPFVETMPPSDTSSDITGVIIDPFMNPSDDISDIFADETTASDTSVEEPQISFNDGSSTDIDVNTDTETNTDVNTETGEDTDSLTESEAPIESESPTETVPPETSAPTWTEPPSTEPPAETPVPTEPPVLTEPPSNENSDPISTTVYETTTAPAIAPPGGDSNGIGGEPVEGDPDGFATTIMLIVGAAVLFVLILIVPPIYRKIRKSIIYKYD